MNFNSTNIVSLEYGVSNYIEEIKDVEGKSESYLSIYIEGKSLNAHIILTITAQGENFDLYTTV